MQLYSDTDKERVKPALCRSGTNDFRADFRRDYARLVHSPSFRRLQGKTQLFPGIESDFFRNRLTHSIEVAQIAKTIAIKLNAETPQLKSAEPAQQIDYDLVELAALAHDIGHPPFGHNGEKALDDCMKSSGGFEGNAQTLRILSKLEKKQEVDEMVVPVDAGKDQRRGLNLTYRSLAAVLKYDSPIKLKRKHSDGLCKGYYQSERDLVADIKKHVASGFFGRGREDEKFKTVECWIMDTADDIAYSTYDLEDALKGGFVSPLRLLSILTEDQPLLKRIKDKVNDSLRKTGEHVAEIDEGEVLHRVHQIFYVLKGAVQKDEAEAARILRAYNSSDSLIKNGYIRGDFTGGLVNGFINSIRIDFNESCPALSKVYLSEDTRITVEILKHMTYEIIIMSPRLKIVEHRGYELVKTIFDTLNSEDGHLLLPDDYRALYEQFAGTDDKMRVISDFVAGMTDRYALEFYSRIRETGQSIFKPF
jgi:dGTPase